MKLFATLILALASLTVFAQHYEIPAYDKSEHIIRHSSYTLLYNYETNTAKWVAWELTDEHTTGPFKRTDDFSPDPRLPKAHQVTTSDYRKTGYDRGHLCPAADNEWDLDAMRESFYMSNICPQNKHLNRQWWEHTEEACRRWAKKEGKIYIVCGPIYKNKYQKSIGNKVKVRVPDAFFKVVLSLRKGHEKAIGFYYSNSGKRQTMEDCVRTVNDIEKITGYDFFPMVNDKIEEKIEGRKNLTIWD